MKRTARAGSAAALSFTLLVPLSVAVFSGTDCFAQSAPAAPICNDPNGCAPPPMPEIEDTRSPCERLGGCQDFGGKRSRRKGGLSGFGTRTEKTNVSFSSRRKRHTSVFKAGVKKGRGRRNRGYKGSRRKR